MVGCWTVTVAFVYNRRYSKFDYGPTHPLRVSRLPLTVALMEAYGLLEHPDTNWVEAVPAEHEKLMAFHTEDYLAILRQANQGDYRKGFSMFGLGPGDNPIFTGVYDWAALLSGASLQAARLVAEGRAHISFNIAGGMHHGHPRRASGFCFMNDAAVAIADLVARGLRVAYVDIDAHHGDGVQDAFYTTDRVLTISLHQTGQTLFPGTGYVQEIGTGKGRGFAVNLPFQDQTDNEIYLEAFDRIVPPLVRAFDPDILVTQLGVDALFSDPLANLLLTDRVVTHACRFFKQFSGKWVALGGGGYHMVNVARCWTLALAEMLGVELENELPARFLLRLRDLEPERTRLRNEERRTSGTARLKAEDAARRVVRYIRENVFPIHGINQ